MKVEEREIYDLLYHTFVTPSRRGLETHDYEVSDQSKGSEDIMKESIYKTMRDLNPKQTNDQSRGEDFVLQRYIERSYTRNISWKSSTLHPHRRLRSSFASHRKKNIQVHPRGDESTGRTQVGNPISARIFLGTFALLEKLRGFVGRGRSWVTWHCGTEVIHLWSWNLASGYCIGTTAQLGVRSNVDKKTLSEVARLDGKAKNESMAGKYLCTAFTGYISLCSCSSSHALH